MTIIKASEDPGDFSFEILNEETGNLEVLRFNALEAMFFIEANSDDTASGHVEAMRAVAKPEALVDRLSDYELRAKLITAVAKMRTAENELGSLLNSPQLTASSSSRQGSQTKNMLTA